MFLDPHHANVFVRKNKTTNSAEIVLLDHGLYEYMEEKDRKNLCKMWKAIILKDEDQMKYYAKQLNVNGMLKFLPFLFSLISLKHLKSHLKSPQTLL